MKSKLGSNLLRRGQWLLLVALALAGAAQAQGFPDKSKPMKIIVTSVAGSGGDLLARTYAKALAKIAGMNVIVDNKPGAEHLVGVQAFLASPPDGYTILLTSNSSQTLNPVMIPNLPYDPLKDMIPITGISKLGLVMNLGTSTTFKSAREFVSAARDNPGKYTCASASTNTRLACALLQSSGKINLLNVPYKAVGAAVTAVAAGEVDVTFSEAATARALWESGRLRSVAVTQSNRIRAVPQLPTLREEGLQGYDLTAWYGAWVPQRTPADVVAILRDVFRRVAASKEVVEALAGFSMEPFDVVGDDLTAITRREIEMWTNVVRTQGIKPAN